MATMVIASKHKYYYISDELAELFGEAKGRRMSGNEIERNMQQYVRRNGLQNGLSITLTGSKLAKLFGMQYGETVSHIEYWLNLKDALSKHLTTEEDHNKKLNDKSSDSSSQQTQPASYSPTNSLQNQNEQTSKMLSKKVSKKTVLNWEQPKEPQPVIQSPVIQPSPQSTIPVDNINLCFVGGVSTGKSTILNAIFCEKLTECKIKRTTMVPTVYIENENDTLNLDKPEQIFAKIAKINADIIAKDESGAKVSGQEYTELQFNVGKLDINILPDSYVNVYDIPGLNDARTKDVYYEYLRRNFFKFNLIVFIVDIHSGLNTSDEADILQFIANHTREQLDKNQKKIYTLVVVNKADDMQLVPNSKDQLQITGELGEMFGQVETTVNEVFKQQNITEHLAGIIPLCAIDSYLYRMTKTHGENFIDKLLPEQILKIGINEQGKKFSKKSPEDQKSEVCKILTDSEFVDTMITLSGFGRFEKLLAGFLQQNNTGKQIRIDNLLFEHKKLPKIGAFITANPEKIESIVGLCGDIFKIFDVILKIDKDIGDALSTDTLLEIEDALQKYLEPWILRSDLKSLESVMAYYTQFRYAIFIRYFDKKRDWSIYPSYIQKLIHSRVCILLSTNMITPSLLLQGHEICKMIGQMTKVRFQSIVDSVIRNANKYSALIMNADTIVEDNQWIIQFVKMGEKLGVDMMTFLRYIILNRISDSRNTSDRVLFQKQMIYLQNQEVPIYSYLQYVNQGRRVSPEWVVEGITDAIMRDKEHALDYEYLNRICGMPKGTY